MGIEAKTNQYWIAPSAINITLNALGNPNRTHGSVASGAVISCYIDGIEGLGLDNGRNPKRWPLTLSPTYFNSNTQKYVYVAIPRSETIGTQAVVVFPSEELDLYGKNTSGTQVGSSDYYYIWLRGIISSTNGSTNRTWVSVIDIGSLGTYEDIMDMSDGDWYSYSKVNGIVTFLKNIVMRAGTTFQNLILGNKELTGVATATTSEEYINSDALVATPNFISQHYLRKDSDDTAQGFISFVKGLAVKGKNLLDIIRSTDGLTDSDEAVLSEKRSLATFLRKDKEDSTDHHVTFGDGITTPNAGSSDFVSGEKGWRIYEHNGKSYLEVDNIEARGVFRATVLDIKRRTYSAGTIVGNMANGKVVRVTPLDSSGVSMGVFVYGLNIGNDQWLAVTVREEDGTTYNVAGEEVAVTGTAAAYKIDFLRSDDEVTVTNDWHIGDMARCQEINVQSREMGGGVVLNRNRSWWRVVTAVGTETLPDGRECAYIIVSNAGTALESYDASEHPSGRQANQITVSDGINTVTCWAFDDRLPNDAPMIGDDVCQEGHVFNENDGRQNLKVDKIEDLSLTWYQGIGYDKSDVGHQFSLDVNQPLRVSPEGVVVQAGKFYLGSPIPSNQIENKILTRRWLSLTSSQIYVPRDSSGNIDYQNMQPDAFTIRSKQQVGNNAVTNVNDATIKLYGYISYDETQYTYISSNNGVLTVDQAIETLIDDGFRHLIAQWEENNAVVDSVEITIVIQGEKGAQGQQGQQGIQGPKGDDGNGVELKGSVDVLYNADITGSETSLEGLTGVSIGDCYVVDANRHLYFYNGSSVAFPGNWNDLGEFKGEPGRGVVDIVEYYKATNSNTPMSRPSSDTGWDTDPNLSHLTDQWDANHIYLWNYERTEYSSGTQYERTVPKIIAIWTKDGKGITSIQNKYAITATNVTPAKEGAQGAPTWYNSPIEPTSANPYLWNYEVVQWTEGNSTSTDVHLLCKYGKDAEFYRFKPIIETAAAYLPKDSTTGKLTTSRKVRLNLQYWVYRVVGDMESRVMNLSGFKMKYLRNGAPVPASGYIEPTGNTTDGQYFTVSVDDSDYTQNEGKTIDTILYKVTGTAPSQTETELDRRIVPLVFDAQTVFEIDTENGHIDSIVQGHTTQIQQQATELSQTKDAIKLTAMRSGTDNLIPNSLIKETSSAYGFAYRTGISMTQGKTYTLSINGRISDTAAANNQTLNVYLYRQLPGGQWDEETPIIIIALNTTIDSTQSITFTIPLPQDVEEAPITFDDYRFSAYMYPSGGDRTGTVTLNWVKLEEGSTATEYHSDADSAYAQMKITSDAIEQEVNGTKTRLDEGGFTVTGHTKFEGDVTIQGTLTGTTTYLEDSDLPPDMTILDMKEKSSVTVSARRAADDTIPTLILPLWNKFVIDDSAATNRRFTPEYRIEGTHITITNPYNPDYATWRWFEDNSQNADTFDTYGLGLLKHCVLIVADPRLVSKRMYDGDNSNNDYIIRMWLPEDATPTHWKDAEGGDHYGISESIPADGYYDVVVSWRPDVNGDNDSLDSYKLEKMQGNFICEGIRGRQLLLLPGQSVELVSRKGNVVSGDWNADYLYWQVVNAKEFESIKMWFRQSVSQSGSPLAPVWGNASENRRWTVGTNGFSESGGQYQSAIFSAPQMGNGYAQPTSGTYPERQLDFDLVANQIRANEYDDQ